MKVDIKFSGLLGLGLLWIMFPILGYSANWHTALQWLLQAGLLWAWVWYLTWKRADLNRISPTAPLLNNLGWANRLTLLRGYLIALTGGFLFQNDIQGFLSWIPGLLYGVAAILDRMDGFVARKTKQTTLLGAELDTVFDALGLLVAPILAVAMGKVHWSYLSLSFAFYFFNWGLYWRRKHGLAIYPLMPSQLRRALAGFQMGFVALALLPCFAAEQTLVCGFAFLIPVLLGFIIDWWVVSGRIDVESRRVKSFFQRASTISRTIFQPCLRIFIFVGAGLMLYQVSLFAVSPGTQFCMMLLFIFAIGLVLLGLLGRIGALIILLMLSASTAPISLLTTALLCSCAWLLLLGTGRFSVWQWDDLWVHRQDGANV